MPSITQTSSFITQQTGIITVSGAELLVNTINQDEVHDKPVIFFYQKKKLAMVGSKKQGKTKTEWKETSMAEYPFHCVHGILDARVCGTVFVQATVSQEACLASRLKCKHLAVPATGPQDWVTSELTDVTVAHLKLYYSVALL